MNKVILVGNLTRDPEYRTTPSGAAVCNFSIAVQRRFANQQGVREADFINCVAWRQQADFVHRFFTKGRKIGVVGSIQTRTYEAQDGSKQYQGRLLGLENGVLSIEEENGNVVKFEQKDIASVRLAVIF